MHRGANEDIGDPGTEQPLQTERQDRAVDGSKEGKVLPGTNSCTSEKKDLGLDLMVWFQLNR